MCHDSFTRVPWFIHTCDIKQSCVTVPCLMHTCAMTYPYAWFDLFISVAWCIHMWLRHASFGIVPQSIYFLFSYTCATKNLLVSYIFIYVCHEASIFYFCVCVPWIIKFHFLFLYLCATKHLYFFSIFTYVRHEACICMNHLFVCLAASKIFLYVYTYVPRRICLFDMTDSGIHPRRFDAYISKRNPQFIYACHEAVDWCCIYILCIVCTVYCIWRVI